MEITEKLGKVKIDEFMIILLCLSYRSSSPQAGPPLYAKFHDYSTIYMTINTINRNV